MSDMIAVNIKPTSTEIAATASAPKKEAASKQKVTQAS